MKFMRRIGKNGTVFYVSGLLQAFPNVIHAVTTRHGGVSPAPFDSMNLSAHVGDNALNVRENLARLHDALDLPGNRTVDASQAQADRVAIIGENEYGTRIKGVDSLITNRRGIPLMLRFADCVPILMYDPTNNVIGIAHAGWRGTVGKVVTNTVATMQQAYGTKAQDLIAYIGPSIGPCCYQIGADVRERVEQAFPRMHEQLLHANGKLHLNLWEANGVQLRALGVEQIEIAAVCTADHTDDFYSWRRENAQTGRFGAIIALR